MDSIRQSPRKIFTVYAILLHFPAPNLLITEGHQAGSRLNIGRLTRGYGHCSEGERHGCELRANELRQSLAFPEVPATWGGLGYRVWSSVESEWY